MKKVIILFIIVLTSLGKIDAQSYDANKVMYDHHQYQRMPGDPYSPLMSGVCSLLIPGLGQIICDEPARGLYFMGGIAGCAAVSGIGALLLLGSFFESWGGEDAGCNTSWGLGLWYTGLAGMVAIDIWSVIDAVKVAKVKNMYFQDHKGISYQLKLKPYLETLSMGNEVIRPVGLTLNVTF